MLSSPNKDTTMPMDFGGSRSLYWNNPGREESVMDSKSKVVTRWVVILTGIGSLMAALDTLVVSTG